MKMAERSQNQKKKKKKNYVEKGEIARYDQFLLSHNVSMRLALRTSKNQGLFWERVKARSLSSLQPEDIHREACDIYGEG